MNNAVELISTGAELLNGRTLNRHAQTLAVALEDIGMKLVRDTTIPDDVQVIHHALAEALQRIDVVMVSGGLGPTQDDLTRDGIAACLGRGIVMDPASLERIRAICKERSLACSPAREQQALIVEGAQALPNRVGAAPGQYIELDRKCIFVLPGPPGEFKAVLHDHVIPRLREIFQTESGFREKLFMTCGLPEADMITLFEREQFPPAGVDIAFCAAPGRIEVRLSSYDQEKLEQAAARLRTLIKHHIFAQERMTMAQAVGRLLIEKGQTVATAESCTGGMLGAELTDFSGSSRFYKGGIIAYDNDVKDRQLGVAAATLEQQGAVSAETAKQMAAGVRERLQADYGLGITGIAGPSGGTSEKPVGLVYIGLADVRQVTAHEFQFGGGRERVREWSRQMALFLLRERITAH